CPHCSARSLAAPGTLPSAGLERAWDEPAEAFRGELPGGLLLLEPRDPDFDRGLAALLGRLTAAGIEQFLVDEGLAARTAEILAGEPGLGLVLPTGAVTASTAIGALPTAL